jgi:hypothetical protein
VTGCGQPGKRYAALDLERVLFFNDKAALNSGAEPVDAFQLDDVVQVEVKDKEVTVTACVAPVNGNHTNQTTRFRRHELCLAQRAHDEAGADHASQNRKVKRRSGRAAALSRGARKARTDHL